MLINKYSKTYYSLIEKVKQRGWKKTKGRERHHIIPQSLGGTNEKDNLVYITPREHFICHWLLIKMTEGDERGKMLYALQGMKAENRYQQRYHTKITARVYEKYRIEHAKNHSKTMKGKPSKNKGIPLSEEHKQRLREIAKANHASGKIYSEESQQKRIAKVLGQKRSEETKQLMSLKSKGIPKGPQSEEHKLAISLAGKGIKKKEGHGANVANAVKGNISINKDGIEKKVKQDILQQYLDDGWKLGGRKRK